MPTDDECHGFARVESEPERARRRRPRDASNRRPDQAVVAGALRAPWKWERADRRRVGRRRRSGALAAPAATGCASEYDATDRARSAARGSGVAAAGRARARSAEPRAPRGFAMPIVDDARVVAAHATWGEWLDALRRAGAAGAAPAGARAARARRAAGDGGIGPVVARRSARRAAPSACARSTSSRRPIATAASSSARRTRRAAARSRSCSCRGLAERLFPQKLREDPLLLDDEMREPLGARARRPGRSREDGAPAAAACGRRRDRTAVAVVSAARRRRRARRACRRSTCSTSCARSPARIPDHEELQRRRRGGRRREARLAGAGGRHRTRSTRSSTISRRCGELIDHARSARPCAATRTTCSGSTPRCADRSSAAGRARSRAGAAGRPGRARRRRSSRCSTTQRLGARPYSVSALQKFTTCPYQFVLSAIYRLQPNEEPEPLQRLDPLTRGRLSTRCRPCSVGAMRDSGRLPVTPPASPRRWPALDAVLERVAAEYEETARSGDRAGLARRDRRASAAISASGSASCPRPTAWTPEYFEFSFGLSRRGTRRAQPARAGDDRRSLHPARIGRRHRIERRTRRSCASPTTRPGATARHRGRSSAAAQRCSR